MSEINNTSYVKQICQVFGRRSILFKRITLIDYVGMIENAIEMPLPTEAWNTRV